MDGAPNNGASVPITKVDNPTDKVGAVQCCRNDNECARRDPWDSEIDDDCITPQGNEYFVSYNEAEELCATLEPAGEWDLCELQLLNANPSLCQGKGCSHDSTYVWTKRLVASTGNTIFYQCLLKS